MLKTNRVSIIGNKSIKSFYQQNKKIKIDLKGNFIEKKSNYSFSIHIP